MSRASRAARLPTGNRPEPVAGRNVHSLTRKVLSVTNGANNFDVVTDAGHAYNLTNSMHSECSDAAQFFRDGGWLQPPHGGGSLVLVGTARGRGARYGVRPGTTPRRSP